MLKKKIDHRMTTVHSSALAAMLCFINVSLAKPLKIEINNQTYTFTKFDPEYCNECMNIGGRSKIDVALLTEDEKVVLFFGGKVF